MPKRERNLIPILVLIIALNASCEQKPNNDSDDDGIIRKDYLVIQNGNITDNSTSDALKSDNKTDQTNSLLFRIFFTGTVDLCFLLCLYRRHINKCQQ